MAVWSMVKLSALATGMRLDGEYYQPCNLADARKLAATNPKSVGTFAFVTDGIHASPDEVEEGGVRYLSAKCVKDNAFALGDTLQISESQHAANPRTSLRENDVLITTVGTIGNAAVVQPEILPANVDRHLGIVRINEDAGVDPYYLATFLNCEFGRFQSLREATGNVQLNLFIEKIRELQVPILACARDVAKQTRAAYKKRTEASETIALAESRLMRALELDRLDLVADQHQVAKFSAMVTTQRYDAEHFCLPGLRKWRSPFPTRPLGDSTIATWVSNGATPAAKEYAEAGLPIIKVGDVDSDALATWGGESVQKDAPAARGERGALLEGDIVVLCAAHHIRYIGKAGLFVGIDGYRGPVRSVGELITVRAGSAVNQQSLCLYLNLSAVRSESQRHVRGLSAHLYPNDFRQIPVPLLPKRLQEELAELFKQSLSARREATRLLNQAKQAIEEAITGEISGKGK